MELYAITAFLVVARGYCCPGDSGSYDGAESPPDIRIGCPSGNP